MFKLYIKVSDSTYVLDNLIKLVYKYNDICQSEVYLNLSEALAPVSLNSLVLKFYKNDFLKKIP